jgi:hypothetical protein
MSTMQCRLVRTAVLAGAVMTAALSVGATSALADDMKPSPWVQSSQGEVRKSGTQGEYRSGDILEPSGQGDVRQSPIAVPGTKARGFQGIYVGPALGGW